MPALKPEQAKPRLLLVGLDGNAFAILGRAHAVAQKAGWSREQWQEVRDEAVKGDYGHLLQTMIRNFDCD